MSQSPCGWSRTSTMYGPYAAAGGLIVRAKSSQVSAPLHLGEFSTSGFAGMMAPVQLICGLASETEPAAGLALRVLGMMMMARALIVKHNDTTRLILNRAILDAYLSFNIFVPFSCEPCPRLSVIPLSSTTSAARNTTCADEPGRERSQPGPLGDARVTSN